MKEYCIVLVLCVLCLCSGCKSDDAMSQNEYELRTLLNHEWEATEINSYYTEPLVLESSITTEEIEELFNIKTMPITYSTEKMTLGMNKKGGFYALKQTQYSSSFEYGPKSIFYSCTTQEGNKFSGRINDVSFLGEPKAYDGEVHMRKIDTNTIKVLILYYQVVNSKWYINFNVYVLNKKGAWNEKTSVKSLLERYNVDAQFIEFIGGEHFERDVAQGRCK